MLFSRCCELVGDASGHMAEGASLVLVGHVITHDDHPEFASLCYEDRHTVRRSAEARLRVILGSMILPLQPRMGA
jgi:hypothetical protein